jgi:uncharacterized C2H2 Zn-finger protein
MIVLCDNPECGAVLRTAPTYSPTQTVLKREGDREFFDCPRCGQRTALVARDTGDASPHPTARPNP